jgi:hypothetical protein
MPFGFVAPNPESFARSGRSDIITSLAARFQGTLRVGSDQDDWNPAPSCADLLEPSDNDL